MKPDFNKRTIEIVAKRAAFFCSNPICQVSTVGPNSNKDKATVIGEAAHIFGARKNSSRYVSTMSDAALSELTNAIWLCRNCHKLVDGNPEEYDATTLFSWRESHEAATAETLGTSNNLKISTVKETSNAFAEYPPLVRRLAIDKPIGWEWRLTAELMRHLNSPLFRKLSDLRKKQYTRPLKPISDEEVIDWVQLQLAEIPSLINPMASLFDRLTESWGQIGEQGNIEEIHHTCLLIRDNIDQVVRYEESIRFVKVSSEFENLTELFWDCIGTQIDKISTVPKKLDAVVDMALEEVDETNNEPTIISEVIEIELPKNWSRKLNFEIKRANRIIANHAIYRER
jgi:hypothetical protein